MSLLHTGNRPEDAAPTKLTDRPAVEYVMDDIINAMFLEPRLPNPLHNPPSEKKNIVRDVR